MDNTAENGNVDKKNIIIHVTNDSLSITLYTVPTKPNIFEKFE